MSVYFKINSMKNNTNGNNILIFNLYNQVNVSKIDSKQGKLK